LVDLKKFQGLPGIFMIPSGVIFEYFKDAKQPRFRYHESVEKLEPYKNNWDILKEALGDGTINH
jgi:hypothetical protein